MKEILKRVAGASTTIKVLMALQVILIGMGVAELFDPCMWKHGLFMIVVNAAFLYVNYEWNTRTY
jgi:hypothetical protein